MVIYYLKGYIMKHETFVSRGKVEYKVYSTNHGDLTIRDSTTNSKNSIMNFQNNSYKIKNNNDLEIQKIIDKINNLTNAEIFMSHKKGDMFGHKKQLIFSRGEDATDLRVDTKTNGSVLFYSDSKYLMYPALKYQEKVKNDEEAIDKVNDNDQGLSLGFKVKAISKSAISKRNRYHR